MLCKMKQLPNLWSLNQDLLSVFQVMMSSLVWVIMFSILMTFSIISNVFYIFSFIHTQRYKIFTHSIICFCVITVAIFVNPGVSFRKSELQFILCRLIRIRQSQWPLPLFRLTEGLQQLQTKWHSHTVPQIIYTDYFSLQLFTSHIIFYICIS